MENSLIRTACLSRDLTRAISASGVDEQFSPRGETVFKIIKNYYEQDSEAKQVDLNVLRHRLEGDRHSELLLSVIEGVETDESLSPANWQYELNRAQLEELNTQIAQMLLQPEVPEDSLRELLSSRDALLSSSETENAEHAIYNQVNVHDILESVDVSRKVAVAPASLNNHLGGGLLAPCHVLIFARPDAGKTTFILNWVRAFTEQGLNVLYYGNEDSPQVILLRALQAYTGATEAQLRNHQTQAHSVAAEKGYEKLFLVFPDEGSLQEIEHVAKEVEADAIFIDQIRNLKSSVKDNRVLELESLARGARSLGKRLGTITVSVAQAGDSAHNKLTLEQGDLDWSNTGVQGTVELMLGLGVNDEQRALGTRCVVACKNKVNGNKDPMFIRLNEQLCRVAD